MHAYLQALILTCLVGPVGAQQLAYYTEMDGDQVNSGQPGTGFGEFTIDPATNTFDYHIEHSGMLHAESAAHVHGPAPPGADGPIALFLPVGSPKNGTWNYPEALEADLLAGLYYVNIHSHEVLTGEMRGQIVPRPLRACDCGSAAVCGNAAPGTGCANSTGRGARLEHTGLASVLLDTFRPRAEGLPALQFGLMYLGPLAVELPFGDGLRCVGGTTLRLAVQQADASGVLEQPTGLVAATNGLLEVGATWHLQCWYRDPGGACGGGFNLSDALSVTYVP